MSNDAAQAQPPPLRRRLRDALVVAMKRRDRVAVTVLRSTLAAIDNAEAVDVAAGNGSSAIESSPVGIGVAEVERRALSDEDIAQIVRSEVAEREAAALDYDRAGRPERAEALRAEVRVLSSHL
ncbi:GatB/YqeY domain-containing protein [Actinomadura sp. DC4]|uniref:GatB/YqeY domain-containing protein n=1 Tax=Actinomadura sp. DC4 TaxID=3055069 RepID=UPI0025B1188F|nr:GatB/YqeY domain-containing protein [Actinomadura sp. DC4]MDN3353067.1 GatB/YqeY domain-containing protein [Actinomadura sp. DC4]